MRANRTTRGNYDLSKYTFESVADGGARTVYAGKDDVTSEDIRILRCEDSREVDGNMEYLTGSTRTQRHARKVLWLTDHPGEEYRFTDYTVSVDAFAADDDDAEDKNDLFATEMDYEALFTGVTDLPGIPWLSITVPQDLMSPATPAVQRLRELIETLSETEQRVYALILFGGFTKKETGELLGFSAAYAGQVFREVEQKIEQDPVLRRIYRK